MNRTIPITVWFNDDLVVGSAEMVPSILEKFAKGDYVLAPSYIKHPDGSITITSLSIIRADHVMTNKGLKAEELRSTHTLTEKNPKNDETR